MELCMFPSQLQNGGDTLWPSVQALPAARLHAAVLLAKPRRNHSFLSQLSQDQVANQFTPMEPILSPGHPPGTLVSRFPASCSQEHLVFSDHWPKLKDQSVYLKFRVVVTLQSFQKTSKQTIKYIKIILPSSASSSTVSFNWYPFLMPHPGKGLGTESKS